MSDTNISFNTSIWKNNATFQALLKNIHSYYSVELNNILQTAIPSFLTALKESLPKHNLIFLTNKSRSDFYKLLHEIERVQESQEVQDTSNNTNNLISHYFNNSFLEDSDTQKLSSLVNICHNLLHQTNNFYLFNNSILQEPLPSKQLFKELKLEVKNNYNFTELLNTLVSMGYTRVDNVLELGQFALRGDILDIYPSNNKNSLPYRVIFFDEEIETINSFDLQTQRTLPHKSYTDILINDYLLFNSLFEYSQLETKLLEYIEELNTAEQAFWLEDINNNNWQRFIPWILETSNITNILEYINPDNTILVTDSYTSLEHELQTSLNNQLNKLSQAKDKSNIPPSQYNHLVNFLNTQFAMLKELNKLTVLQISV